MTLRLIVFDVDGTLADSQTQVAAAFAAGFTEIGRSAPTLTEVRAVIGLSLPMAVARLASDAAPDEVDRAVLAYRKAFAAGPEAPLFAGAADLLARLAAQPETLLGIATGKSRRGADRFLAHHGLDGLFQTLQTADLHPSKPHPAMLTAALDAVGVERAQAVMVGDATFDMDMAREAGVPAVGVGWGYHADGLLIRAGARCVAPDFEALERALDLAPEFAA